MLIIKKMSYPKYSIIIPVRNGAKYLPTCVKSIICQDFDDYELIISDNHSSDGTSDYLNNLKHPKIKILKPDCELSMVEHWEFVLSHARGEWQIILGADDGLQKYFFELAEKLTRQADLKNIRAIQGCRAYFFWSGCDTIYGNMAVNYNASNYIKSRNCKLETVKALLGLGKSYFDLPQMYSTGIFKKSLIDEAKKRQGGKIFNSITPDANLAAICCSIENKYLESGIPLGWVGSSPSSNGFSFSMKGQNNSNEFANVRVNDFLNLNNKSNLSYNKFAGNINFGSATLYFWESLLKTNKLRKGYLNSLLMSKLFKTLMFSTILLNINKNERLLDLKKIININNCNYNLITKIILILPILYKLHLSMLRVLNKTSRLLNALICFHYSVGWDSDSDTNMLSASMHVNKLLNDNKLIQKIKII